MIDINISDQGNIALSNTGDILLVSEGNEIAQACRTALQAWYGEYFLDQTFGLNYLDKILNKPFKQARIEREVRRVLKTVDGIKSISNVNISIDDQNEITGSIDIISIYAQETITL